MSGPWNDRIVEAGLEVLYGTLRAVTKPGYCLAFVRQVVERALGLNSGEFYRRFVDPYFYTRSGEEVGRDIHPRWARGAERALRAAGLAVALGSAAPGDLLFNYRVSRPYGHVGVLMPGGLVLENTTADRGWRRPDRGAVRLTPMREWGVPTTVARLVPR